MKQFVSGPAFLRDITGILWVGIGIPMVWWPKGGVSGGVPLMQSAEAFNCVP